MKDFNDVSTPTLRKWVHGSLVRELYTLREAIEEDSENYTAKSAAMTVEYVLELLAELTNRNMFHIGD